MNIYVFTTKFVLKKGSTIVYVVHESDGDWQFLGSEENLSESDAMIVSLNEILDYDPSLFSILDLPMGKEAIRKEVGENWEIKSI